MGITHTTAAGGTDSGDGKISKNAWNESHSGETFTKLSTTTLGADATDITVTGISGAYRDLIVVFKARSTKGSLDDFYVRVGSGSIDTAAHYAYFVNYAGSGNSSANANGAAFGYVGPIPGANRTSTIYASGELTLTDYASATDQKQFATRGWFYESGVETYHFWGNNVWNQTTAIDQIRLYPATGPNLKAGSSLTIYGRG